MNRKREFTMRTLYYTFFILFFTFAAAQVVTTIPEYATANDQFVVVFNAAEGDGGLQGYSGVDIYAHTGVTIEGEGTWKYVVAGWDENTAKAKLTKAGANLWHLNIGNPYDYYGVPLSKKITQLSFVFRNSDASQTGRDVGAADIFLDLYEPGLTVDLVNPEVNIDFGDPKRSPVFINHGDTLAISAAGIAIGTKVQSMELFIDGQSVYQIDSSVIQYDFISADWSTGYADFKITGIDTSGIIDSTIFSVMINPAPVLQARAQGIKDGINYIDDAPVTLSLFAPYKEFVYVLGDFNNWMVDEDYLMNKEVIDNDSVHFWLDLAGLTAKQEYAFQYYVDGEIRIADPYTDKILDPWNDKWITSETYPGLLEYSDGKTTEAVSVLQTDQDEYEWQAADFVPPDADKLVIYEMLVRDFIAAHDYKTLTDTLDYFVNLGINAIELMPVNEFEGNESWGYNPSFYFAPDKYYGTKDDLKTFIDACHERGMAVIIDMVLNHSYGQSPFVRLYNEGTYGKPTPENPWYNVESPNTTYSWGYDFNHESAATKRLVDRVNRYWLNEYNVDGFRFDFTKGFTNRSGDGGGYDASRIAILKRIADAIWQVDDDAYVILEHFADNSEEKELAAYGMLIWGNTNYNYSEATMGYNSSGKSNFSWGFYKSRGWTKPHLVTYMESHDEERLMYKNLQHGNSYGNYSVKDLYTALQRIKLVQAFFLTLPGPKMIWQFGELGYDYSIDYNGRVGNKPIRWNYLEDEDRKNLYKTIAALLKLRHENYAFNSSASSVTLSVNSAYKEIKIIHGLMKAVIIGNFGVAAASKDVDFQQPGNWYDYFSGDSLVLASNTINIELEAGEFHIYTDKKLETPEPGLVTGVFEKPVIKPAGFSLQQNYPNPFNPRTVISYQLPAVSHIELAVYNVLGQKVQTLVNAKQSAGSHQAVFDGTGLASGIYFYQLKSGKNITTRKMILMQ